MPQKSGIWHATIPDFLVFGTGQEQTQACFRVKIMTIQLRKKNIKILTGNIAENIKKD